MKIIKILLTVLMVFSLVACGSAKLLASDMVVFATPLYYYGMTAQLKAVVDRFCAYNSSLNSRHWKCNDNDI